MYKTIFAITALATLLQLSPADAQSPWALEFRGSAAVGTQDQDSETAKWGYGFGATIQYDIMPHFAVYTGWDLTHFEADETLGVDRELEETGYVLGLRFEHPIGDWTRTSGWIRAGAMYNHLELEDAEGDVIGTSDHDLGWEAGAGLAYAFGNGWSLTPGLRFRTLSRDLEVGTTTMPVELRYMAFEIGLSRAF